MLIRITMKDPDGVWEGVMEAVQEANPGIHYLDACDEVNAIMQTDRFKQVFTYGECIEFWYDTDTGGVSIIYNT